MKVIKTYQPNFARSQPNNALEPTLQNRSLKAKG